jgi:Zn-dependent protease
MMLATVDFNSPLTWAIIIGWIMSVVLHEWAHGFVAYLGGDYTIRERGGLSLNPLQYIHPVNSILLPIIFLMMGGIPLAGGATYIRRDLLRNSFWGMAVSLAGPGMNVILFLLLSLPFHPWVGWVDVNSAAGASTKPVYLFLAAQAQLQIMAAIINLFPLPPLDGFQAVASFMDEKARRMLMQPQVAIVSLVVLFAIISQTSVIQGIYMVTDRVLLRLGFGYSAISFMSDAYNFALFGA